MMLLYCNPCKKVLEVVLGHNIIKTIMLLKITMIIKKHYYYY